MSEPTYLKAETSDGIARVTFARPKHNVFNIAMINEFNSVLEALIDDTSLKCLVLLGDGPSWCAGVDVGDHRPEMVDEMIPVFNRIFELMDRLAVPSIAAVHGACLGGGMEVAIACDMILAGKSAVFGQPEIKLGFLPPYAAIRLPGIVGPARAIEICTTGKRYSAEEAERMGLCRSVDDDGLSAELEKFVGEIAACSPLILRLNKRAVKQHLGMNFAESLEGVTDLFLNTLMKTEDTLEGIASFYEKRKPEWKNR
jgi:cyclohexa-1,5-dienecarbonyl-CoA hydratase